MVVYRRLPPPLENARVVEVTWGQYAPDTHVPKPIADVTVVKAVNEETEELQAKMRQSIAKLFGPFPNTKEDVEAADRSLFDVADTKEDVETTDRSLFDVADTKEDVKATDRSLFDVADAKEAPTAPPTFGGRRLRRSTTQWVRWNTV